MLWILSLTAALYAAFLFRVAWRTEASPYGAHWVDRPESYALALAIYCTSWTFFGAVGTAAVSGWSYLPIYLGPALLFLFGRSFLRRLAEAVRRENLTSIADYISSRFGKSRSLAAIVTIIATLAALPYIALQLKSLGMSAAAVLADDVGAKVSPSDINVALMAVLLTVFAIMFGARRYEATGKNRGLIAAIAVEGVVKIVAFSAIGILAVVVFLRSPHEFQSHGFESAAHLFSISSLAPNFLTITLLSMCAIICLPRQFYIGFVEYRRADDLKAAFRIVPIYMALTALVVLPITVAGLALLPASAPPDLYVLDLPLAYGAQGFAVLAFLGGFSAATGMVVVECVALSTMISNDLIAPFFLKRPSLRSKDMGATLLLTRRLSIVALMVLAFVAYLAIDDGETLASIGLVAFAAAAQFAPALIASLYWPRASQRAARWGLMLGGLIWLYTLLLPTLFGVRAFEGAGLTGVFGGALHPRALLWLCGLDPLTHGVLWSLGANIVALLVGTQIAPATIADRLRAAVFNPGAAVGGAGGVRTLGDLLALAERFVGADEARLAFAAHQADFSSRLPATSQSARLAETLIAKVIGAPSARVIVNSALSDGAVDVADVVSLIDETKQALQFSRELLASTLDNISQGVSVVDSELRLVAWNQAYLDMFEFPPGFIQVGRPIADVVRYNAERGECGPGEVDAHVERRLAAMRRLGRHTYERVRPNGAVLKTFGNPMPGGGYVTSFADITAEKRAQEALVCANEALEERVSERTHELDLAKNAAEAATLSKTKFLAAASHDLLQPLNAARLFSAALNNAIGDNVNARSYAQSIDRSIAAADSLLRALLDMSRLEAGGVAAKMEEFAIGPLIQDLALQFAPLASARDLTLRFVDTQLWVRSDRSLLRSALQNFLSNALRYSRRGGVLIGCRRRGARIVLEVWDTGPGIDGAHRRAVFEEFRRLDTTSEEPGAGLGLAIVDRIARVLDARVDLRSVVGKGSVFSIDAVCASVQASAILATTASTGRDLHMKILCVDNEPEILAGLSALLSEWGAQVVSVETSAQAKTAITQQVFDVALIDYHLGAGQNGIDVAHYFRGRVPHGEFAIITASRDEDIDRAARQLGGVALRKPIPAADLRAFLERARASAQVEVQARAPLAPPESD